jgi:hypothetical protein
MGDEEARNASEEQDAVAHEEVDPKLLSTGLRLSLEAADVEAIWSLSGGGDGQGPAENEAQLKKLAELLGRSDDKSFQNEVVLEFHLSHLERSRKLDIAPRKAAVFHAIMEATLSAMQRKSKVTTCVGEPYTSSECFAEYQRLMLQHCTENPPCSLGIFLGAEARQLTDCAAMSIFRHYALYQYCLVCPRELVTLHVDMSLESPLPPPNLMIGKLDTRKRKTVTKERGVRPIRTSSKEVLAEEVPEEELVLRHLDQAVSDTEEQLSSIVAKRDEALEERKKALVPDKHKK